MSIDPLRYPVGRFEHDGPITQAHRDRWTDEIAALPDRLRAVLQGLDARQLGTPYRPGGWTVHQVAFRLPDSHLPVAVALSLLDGIHARWAALLRGLSEEQFGRTYLHPDDGEVSVERATGIYAWHGQHHLAHVTALIEREGW
jgi:hypothetical protein